MNQQTAQKARDCLTGAWDAYSNDRRDVAFEKLHSTVVLIVQAMAPPTVGLNVIVPPAPLRDFVLLIPDKDDNSAYPGCIQPGNYDREGLQDMLREHKNNPAAIQFIADML